MQAHQISSQLERDGFDMVRIGQGGISLSEPSKHLERLWLSRRLRHGGHPVLRWNASNTMVRTYEGDNILPSKKKSRERIDGIVSLIMALVMAVAGLLILEEDEEGEDFNPQWLR